MPEVIDRGTPIVYFEDAPSITVTGGIVAIALSTRIGLPGKGGAIEERHVAVCHVRCNEAGLASLAVALQKAMEMLSKPMHDRAFTE